MKPRIARSSSREFLGLATAALLVSASAAHSATVNLSASQFTITIPATGEVVTMWGYSQGTGTTQVPGAPIVVPPGDTTLTVNLTNNLPEPTSVVILGQSTPASAPAGPVWIDANGAVTGTGSRAPGDTTSRVRSFTGEAASGGGTATYTFSNLKPGTYLLESGTHPGLQVQMGLYASVEVQYGTTGGAASAYPGVPYDKEVTILVSELDADFNNAVGAGRYAGLPLSSFVIPDGGPVPRATPPPGPVPPSRAGTITSPVNFYPRYYLLNGTPYAAGSAISQGTTSAAVPALSPLSGNDVILVRFLNAGLKQHSLEILSPKPGTAPMPVAAPYFTLVAEDGNPYQYPRQRYSVFLPAGKTVDAVFSSGAGTYPIQDHALALTNGNRVADAGLQTALAIAPGTNPTAVADAYAVSGNTPATSPLNVLTVPAPGVLSNDVNPTANPMTAVLQTSPAHGTLVWDAGNDGGFTYTPATGFAGIDTFTYKANNGGNSNAATVTITVSLPPVAAADAYTVVTGQTLTIAAPGVLGNDTSPAGLPLTAVLGTLPAAGTLTLNTNGSFTYVAPAAAGPQTFTYTASDGTLSSAPATVTINVTAPQPPVANADSYTTTASPSSPSLSVAAPGVLGNDTSPNGLPLTAVLGTTTTKGTLTLNANGSFTYWTTNTSATTDTFTYRASDGTLQSALATVTINITAHPKPVANNDTFSAARRTVAAYTPVNLNVLANDTATAPATLPNLASTVTILSQPSRGGTIALQADGTINYTPARNFQGSDVFTYSVKDTLNSTSNTARVTVNVH